MKFGGALCLFVLVVAATAARRADALYTQDVGRGVKLHSEKEIESVILHISDGSLRGTRVNGTDYFLGIPFANPPVDNMRWRAPQPVTPWSGVRDAIVYAPDCTSSHSNYIYLGTTSEDCLYLNVFRPATATDKSKLPVMAWLYGGSWEYGGSSFFVYDGAALSEIGNVIVVTINYRLGAFGYAASPALQKEDPNNSTGNYGTQDQRAALQWIQKNIKAFGGDPDNVMLFGQSAGGGSVSNHAVMPKSNGLFSKIGIESGPPSAWTFKTYNESYSHFRRIAAAIGCKRSSQEAEVACMRTKNTTEVWKHQENDPTVEIDWAPTIDGAELTTGTYDAWQQGKLNNISAMLIGNVKDEGSLFVRHLKPGATSKGYLNWINTTITGNISEPVLRLYKPGNYDSPFLTASAVLTDSEMTCNSRRASHWMAHHNVPSYLYMFSHLPFVVKLAEPGYGVMHSSEVFFVFRSRLLLLGEGEVDLADKLAEYWTNFAWTGNPNKGQHGASDNLPHWPKFDPKTNNYLDLNMTISAKQDFISDEKCKFWNEVYDAGCDVSHLPVSCNL